MELLEPTEEVYPGGEAEELEVVEDVRAVVGVEDVNSPDEA